MHNGANNRIRTYVFMKDYRLRSSICGGRSERLEVTGKIYMAVTKWAKPNNESATPNKSTRNKPLHNSIQWTAKQVYFQSTIQWTEIRCMNKNNAQAYSFSHVKRYLHSSMLTMPTSR